MKDRLLRILDALAATFCHVFGLARGNAWSARVGERVRAVSRTVGDGKGYRFIASSPLLLMRAQTLMSKERETIAWIAGFGPGDVLYDVGANVGVYTVYAATRCRHVYAFEPEASNYSILNQNILLNRLEDRVTAYPIALADRERMDRLRIADPRPGAALHAFGSNIDYKGDPFTPHHLQGCVALTLDRIVLEFGLPFPTHIKIDVDGLEAEVLRGGERVVSDRRLRGLLVEINENDPADLDLVRWIGNQGLSVEVRGPVVADSTRKAAMRNYIFSRHEG